MKFPSLLVCIGAAVLPFLGGVGCSASRGRLAQQEQITQEAKVVFSEKSSYAPVGYQTTAVSSNNSRNNSGAISRTSGTLKSSAAQLMVQPISSSALVSSALLEETVGEKSGMTLEMLEQLAIENNPSIAQASASAQKASGNHWQVGVKPNPTVGYFAEEVGNEGNAGLHGAFISQTFVRGDKLAWNRQVAGHHAQSVRWEVEAQRYRVRTDIRIQFYNVLTTQKRLQLARDFREIVSQGVTVSQQRLKAKMGTRPDLLQSEIQLNEVDLVIQKTELELEAAWKELATIVGLPNLEASTLLGDLQSVGHNKELETAYQKIITESPQLEAARSRVQRARAKLQRQRSQNVSNVTAQLGVGYDDSSGDQFGNLQLSMPWRINNDNRGNIAAAYAENCEAVQEVERIKMKVRRDLVRVMREYQIALTTSQRYENLILPKSEETLKLLGQAQAAGEIDFLRILIARRMLFDAKLKSLTALGNLAQADAKIEGLMLTGGLTNFVQSASNIGIRSQAFSGQ